MNANPTVEACLEKKSTFGKKKSTVLKKNPPGWFNFHAKTKKNQLFSKLIPLFTKAFQHIIKMYEVHRFFPEERAMVILLGFF